MAANRNHSLSGPRVRVAENILKAGLEEALFTHGGYAAALGGTVVAQGTVGKAKPDTLFDLASLTKPIATATSTMQLVEDGQLHLHQPIDSFFSEEFGLLPHLSDIQVRHLLTHTSGLPPLPRWPTESAGISRKELLRATLTTPTMRPPGAGYTYSDTGYILLGEIVSRVDGAPLDSLFLERIAGPLGLASTRFLPPSAWHNRVARTRRTEPAGQVHDPRARGLGGVAGHAGLFGTVADVLTYADTMRRGGGGILSRASVARMNTNQIDHAFGGQSYGFFCAGNDYLPNGDLFSDRAFGHSGFTGTLLLIDPEFDLSLVLLTNRVVNEGEDGSRYLRLRRYWLNAMAAALV